MTKSEIIKKWIMQYINEVGPVSAVDQAFHEKFYDTFGGQRSTSLWGAQTVYKAQRYLKQLSDEGCLKRNVVTTGDEAFRGFPRWVYVYRKRTPGGER